MSVPSGYLMQFSIFLCVKIFNNKFLNIWSQNDVYLPFFISLVKRINILNNNRRKILGFQLEPMNRLILRFWKLWKMIFLNYLDNVVKAITWILWRSSSKSRLPHECVSSVFLFKILSTQVLQLWRWCVCYGDVCYFFEKNLVFTFRRQKMFKITHNFLH